MYGGFVSWRTRKVLTSITTLAEKTVSNDFVRIPPLICCARVSHVLDRHRFGVAQTAHLFWVHLMSWRKCPEPLGLGHGTIANIKARRRGPDANRPYRKWRRKQFHLDPLKRLHDNSRITRNHLLISASRCQIQTLITRLGTRKITC